MSDMTSTGDLPQSIQTVYAGASRNRRKDLANGAQPTEDEEFASEMGGPEALGRVPRKNGARKAVYGGLFRDKRRK